MMLVDSNVLLDILSHDPIWSHWSSERLARLSADSALAINETIYAETSVRMESQAEFDFFIGDLTIRMLRTPRPALFLAGKAYRKYRQAGGIRTGVLPDFFIGAHAEVAGLPILTRDTRRYRAYFPDVEIIAPDA